MDNSKITAIFDKLRTALQQKLEELPGIIGRAGVDYTLEAFEKQAWENVPWDKRKSKKDQGRAILVKSSRLKRSIRIVRTTANSVVWGTDVPYAQVHNDGLPITHPAREEKFIRPRYERGPKSKLFGGMGAFRRMTTAEKNAPEAKGQSYKSYTYTMTRRRFLGDTPDLRERLQNVAKEEIQQTIKQTFV